MNIIESELKRQNLWNDVYSFTRDRLKYYMKEKEIRHFLLRYIFNKNIEKNREDDPIFITTKSPLAKTQIEKDFKYFKIKLSSDVFYQNLEDQIQLCYNQLINYSVQDRFSVQLKNNYLIYGSHSYKDTSNLGKLHPDKLNYALALNIRYKYLYLTTQGLARQYSLMGYKLDDDITESFGSAFNHYFDKYCGAFYDLESHFGSLGSFFSQKVWSTRLVYVNPVFDEVLMETCISKILNDCETNKEIEYIFTIPHWKDFKPIQTLLESKYYQKSIVYKKGELGFIEHMNSQKIIYPCNIIEIFLKC